MCFCSPIILNGGPLFEKRSSLLSIHSFPLGGCCWNLPVMQVAVLREKNDSLNDKLRRWKDNVREIIAGKEAEVEEQGGFFAVVFSCVFGRTLTSLSLLALCRLFR